MEIQQMEDLSSAARLGYWAPHLLPPNEDRVYALGVALQEAIQRINYLEGVEDSNKTLNEQVDILEGEIEGYKNKMNKIRELTL